MIYRVVKEGKAESIRKLSNKLHGIEHKADEVYENIKKKKRKEEEKKNN